MSKHNRARRVRNADLNASARQAALAILRGPNLIDRIVRDTQDAFDIYGESELILTLYLAISSRRLADPISVIVQGEPGSGKTYVIDSICKFVPESELWEATHASPRAIYYAPGGVQHKVINGKERSRITGPEAHERTSVIRQLISDKRVVNRTVRDGHGEEQVVEGPVCYLETTTLKDDEIFDEDLSRCLLLRTTNDEVHRRKVLQTMTLSNGGDAAIRKENCKRIIAEHQLIQSELLEPLPVTIPYSGCLADSFPVTASFTTRLFQRLLFCIVACAYLHQHQRERDGGKTIIATPDDYRIVKPIVDRCLADALSRSMKGTVAKVYQAIRTSGQTTRAALVKQFGNGKRGDFSDRPGRSQVHDAIAKLLEQGAIVEVEKGSGTRAGVIRCFELPAPSMLATGAVETGRRA